MEVNKEGTVEGSLNKPVLRYWFYAYSYSNYQGFGYGNGTLSSSHNFFPLRYATEGIRNDNNAKNVMITNFIEISKDAADEYCGGETEQPKKF